MTLSNPEPVGEGEPGGTDLAAESAVVAATARAPWYLRLPVVSHLRRSVGLQRGMLVAGVVLVGLLLLTALLAPLLAPYGFADTAADGEAFGTQRPPSAVHPLGTTEIGRAHV